MRYLALLLVLAGCATPETILKNKEGNYVTCGGSSVGSVTGGVIGYNIQSDMDEKCVQKHIEQGYSPVKK